MTLHGEDARLIAECEGRLAKITPGNWHYDQMAEVVYDATLKPVCALDWVEMSDVDGFFIEQAPADMRFLLALVKRLAGTGE